MPFEKVSFQGKTLWLEAPTLNGKFEGILQDDGLTIEGTWSQSGLTFPLTLKKNENQ